MTCRFVIQLNQTWWDELLYAYKRPTSTTEPQQIEPIVSVHGENEWIMRRSVPPSISQRMIRIPNDAEWAISRRGSRILQRRVSNPSEMGTGGRASKGDGSVEGCAPCQKIFVFLTSKWWVFARCWAKNDISHLVSPGVAAPLVLSLEYSLKTVSVQAATGSRGLCVHEEIHLMFSYCIKMFWTYIFFQKRAP